MKFSFDNRRPEETIIKKWVELRIGEHRREVFDGFHHNNLKSKTSEKAASLKTGTTTALKISPSKHL